MLPTLGRSVSTSRRADEAECLRVAHDAVGKRLAAEGFGRSQHPHHRSGFVPATPRGLVWRVGLEKQALRRDGTKRRLWTPRSLSPLECADRP